MNPRSRRRAGHRGTGTITSTSNGRVWSGRRRADPRKSARRVCDRYLSARIAARMTPSKGKPARMARAVRGRVRHAGQTRPSMDGRLQRGQIRGPRGWTSARQVEQTSTPRRPHPTHRGGKRTSRPRSHQVRCWFDGPTNGDAKSRSTDRRTRAPRPPTRRGPARVWAEL